MTKAVQDDWRVVADSKCDDADRSAALDRILADGGGDVVELVEPWLGASEFLREQALRALVGRLHVEKYVDLALSWLREDTPIKQMAAAQALGMYVHATGRQQEPICRALAAAMLSARNADVERECYDAILTSLGEPWAEIPDPFMLEKIDWSRVKPFLPVGTAIRAK